MPTSDLLNTIISGSVGASLGTIVAAAIQSRSQKGESRAKAADIVTGAAERIMNRLEKENRAMREALILLTDVLDEIAPELHASPEALAKLKRARIEAMKAF